MSYDVVQLSNVTYFNVYRDSQLLGSYSSEAEATKVALNALEQAPGWVIVYEFKHDSKQYIKN
jgi:hypothetical protein